MRIVVLLETEGQTGLELVAKARTMAPEAEIIALCEGQPSELLSGYGCTRIVLLPAVEDDCAQGNRIGEAITRLEPDIVLFPATIRGRFLSGWVAARLQTGLTADCTGLFLTEEGLLKQVRPAFGGNLTAEILCKTRRPQMASVRPGVFPLPAPGSLHSLPTETLELEPVSERITLKVYEPAPDNLGLQNARVIVAGGKGVGSAKGFDKLRELASLLGGAVGATRSAVDAGWIPYEHQIGQTGVIVHPDLYICFGISGIIQHLVGMNASGTVIAVNKDRNAPIFRCADYGIVADWEETIDEMIQYLKNK